ncbi:hypothetical protein FOI68_10515 [Brevibacillus sp. LEMMJ03]|uniref:hypothetical protein n=1 Tax=Brevibacillus sp. LEMMJ03 TaxID=2595056 RepID=UPI00117C8221|nr:hypothetical protein [Brevibacillus sp. LEMMJ03]TRY25698.1 hypothetical protein FOI68_10515 [Brevibacillus sp. LEMMJ03]
MQDAFNALNSGAGVAGYTIEASGADVTFTADTAAADQAVTISLTDTDTTGTAGTASEVTAGVAPSAGTPEVNKLTVTAGATAAGTNTVTFTDGSVTATATVTLNGTETPAQVATAIADAFNALNSGAGVAGYTITASSADVIFTANSAAADKTVTITLN